MTIGRSNTRIHDSSIFVNEFTPTRYETIGGVLLVAACALTASTCGLALHTPSKGAHCGELLIFARESEAASKRVNYSLVVAIARKSPIRSEENAERHDKTNQQRQNSSVHRWNPFR